MGHNRRQQQRRQPMGAQMTPAQAQALLQQHRQEEIALKRIAKLQQTVRQAVKESSLEVQAHLRWGDWVIPQDVLIAIRDVAESEGTPEAVAIMMVTGALMQVTVQGGTSLELNLTAALAQTSWNNALCKPVVTDEQKEDCDKRFLAAFTHIVSSLQEGGYGTGLKYVTDKKATVLEVHWQNEVAESDLQAQSIEETTGKPSDNPNTPEGEYDDLEANHSPSPKLPSGLLGPDGRPLP